MNRQRQSPETVSYSRPRPINNPDKPTDIAVKCSSLDKASSLSAWLDWLAYLHPEEMELGLQRVSAVAQRAGLLKDLPALVTVAGTNGKGSVVAMLSAVYVAAAYRVGSYTSPHISRFNERISINGEMATDQQIVDALCWVESHRENVSLTYFEFTTLAAMRLFRVEKTDVVILEVGLGGRLDAVNIWDTDCAVITSIAVDHESWLGYDRNTIGREKAGIARCGTPLIIGDTSPPPILEQYANEIGAKRWQINQEFYYQPVHRREKWQLTLPGRTLSLPAPALIGGHQYNNAATAVASVEALQQMLPVEISAVYAGLQNVRLPGRFEVRQLEGLEIVIDVAHNPAAAAALLESLQSAMVDRRAHAVFSIMADKDIDAVIEAVLPCVATWHCGQLDVPRALPADKLVERLVLAGIDRQQCHSYAGVAEALDAAVNAARITACQFSGKPNAQPSGQASGQASAIDKPQSIAADYILIFGSFFTVTAVAELLDLPCH